MPKNHPVPTTASTPSQSSTAPAYSSSGSSPGIGCIRPSKYRKPFSRMLVVMVAHSRVSSGKYSPLDGHAHAPAAFQMDIGILGILNIICTVTLLLRFAEAIPCWYCSRMKKPVGLCTRLAGACRRRRTSSMPYMREYSPHQPACLSPCHLARHDSSTTHNPKAYLWLPYFIVRFSKVEIHRASNARNSCRIGHDEFRRSACDSLSCL